ncbi:hypothetical protein ACFPIJ_52370 [Dactylosporangium cerinum]|uniref:Uncharacterized protein n=1 Tax=Dactylosporangium cerinum TaxID=1434730 RepID=A0ABV9WED3_9ACTN
MAVRYGLLSTHPPTRCGLATFNAALAAQLMVADGWSGGIVRVTADDDDQHSVPGVVHTWPAGSVAGWLDAAEALNVFEATLRISEPLQQRRRLRTIRPGQPLAL